MGLLPLLRKELLEQASQRRTYWMRVLYAVLSSLIVGLVIYFAYEQSETWLEMLGWGRHLFEALMWCGFIGTALFLPALVANTIPAERESGAFELLWLTRLTPTELIAEKFLSRLWPMVTILLVGLPIATLTYTFGGITKERMLIGGYLLFMFAAQVGAWSMIWAVFCKRTIPAFITAITGVVALMFLSPWSFLTEQPSPPPFATYYYFYGETDASLVLRESAVGWIPVIACLLVARLILPFTVVRRPKARRMTRARKRHTARVPRRAPVAWREDHAVGFGGWITGLLYAAFGTAAVGMLIAEQPSQYDSETASTIVFSAWGVAVLSVIVRGVNLVTSERVGQTLAPLLTTPLTGAEIMKQKIAGTTRCLVALVGLLWLLTMVEAFHEGPQSASQASWTGQVYVLVSFALAAVYLPMFLHWGALVGLRVKTRLRGVVLALCGLFVWFVGPPILAVLASARASDDGMFILYASPPAALIAAEFRAAVVSTSRPLWEILFAVLWHVGVLLFIRSLCCSMADSWLGRAEPPPGLPVYDADRAPSPPLEQASTSGPLDEPSDADREAR